jgi:ATP-dependent phosphoenolpyruvate carboxykinase
MGVTEPEATFSACYGGAFLMWWVRLAAASPALGSLVHLQQQSLTPCCSVSHTLSM